MTKADTTLRQLGGSRRLSAMIGARYFMHSDEGRTLTFQFKGSRKVNAIRITLNALDTYDIEILKVSARKCTRKVIFEACNVYADQMKGYIERKTGLYLSM